MGYRQQFVEQAIGPIIEPAFPVGLRLFNGLVAPFPCRQAATSCEAGGFNRPGGNRMNLSPPSQITLILSVLFAVLALLVRYAGVAIPVVSGHSFETMLAPFLLLLAGVLFGGF